MKSVLGSSKINIQKYIENVPERNEGIMSAMQTRAMAKQRMQLAYWSSTHRVLTERSRRAAQRGLAQPDIRGTMTLRLRGLDTVDWVYIVFLLKQPEAGM